MLQDAGFDVYGIDISDDVIKRCIDLNGFNPDKFVAMDILKDKIPFDCKFDLIIAI